MKKGLNGNPCLHSSEVIYTKITDTPGYLPDRKLQGISLNESEH